MHYAVLLAPEIGDRTHGIEVDIPALIRDAFDIIIQQSDRWLGRIGSQLIGDDHFLIRIHIVKAPHQCIASGRFDIGRSGDIRTSRRNRVFDKHIGQWLIFIVIDLEGDFDVVTRNDFRRHAFSHLQFVETGGRNFKSFAAISPG